MPRKPSSIVQLKVRMHEPTRARLEKSAKRRGVSLNAEIVSRLEETLTQEGAFGGPEIENLARLMASAFSLGGQRGAQARGHPEWPPLDWMNDPTAYDAAVHAVVDALIAAQPRQYKSRHRDPKERALHEKIHSGMTKLIASGADIKVKSGSDKVGNDEG